MSEKRPEQSIGRVSASIADAARLVRGRITALARHPLASSGLALVLSSLLFWLVPWLDMASSGLFTGPAGGFPLAASPLLNGVRDLAKVATILLVAVAAVTLVIWLFVRRARWLAFGPAKAIFVLATFAIGPGLLVNAWLKESFGRARPRDLVEFGGALNFTPVWEVSGECLRNCSFSSGEASSAMALLSAAFLLPPGRRWPVTLFLSPFVIVFSLNRIAFGGHFLSDVVLSWIIVLIVMLALDRLLLEPTRKFQIDEAVRGAARPLVVRLGERLARLRQQYADRK